MYAIVEIAGQQFKVEEGKNIFVHRLETEKDNIIEFDKVLLVEDNDKILVG
jgi:large subunit ribosomal protein L21